MILMLFVWAQALDEVMLLRCQHWIYTCWALSSQLKTLSRWRTWLHQRWWISLLFRYCLLIKGLKLFRVDSLYSSTLARCVNLYRFSFRTSSVRNLWKMRGWGFIPYPFTLFDWSWRRRLINLGDLFYRPLYSAWSLLRWERSWVFGVRRHYLKYFSLAFGLFVKVDTACIFNPRCLSHSWIVCIVLD